MPSTTICHPVLRFCTLTSGTRCPTHCPRTTTASTKTPPSMLRAIQTPRTSTTTKAGAGQGTYGGFCWTSDSIVSAGSSSARKTRLMARSSGATHTCSATSGPQPYEGADGNCWRTSLHQRMESGTSSGGTPSISLSLYQRGCLGTEPSCFTRPCCIEIWQTSNGGDFCDSFLCHYHALPLRLKVTSRSAGFFSVYHT